MTVRKVSVTHRKEHVGSFFTSDDGLIRAINDTEVEIEDLDLDSEGNMDTPEVIDLLNTHASYPEKNP